MTPRKPQTLSKSRFLAGLEYLRMIDPSISTDEKEKIKKNLLAYCGQDTLAMVKIREELIQK